jgi:hypothetical protein
MGTFGFIGFLAEFGLLAVAVFRAAAALRFAASPPDRVALAALALIVAITMIDQLPNSNLNAWAWLMTGALLGRAEALSRVRRQQPAARAIERSLPSRASSVAQP